MEWPLTPEVEVTSHPPVHASQPLTTADIPTIVHAVLNALPNGTSLQGPTTNPPATHEASNSHAPCKLLCIGKFLF